MGTQRPRKDVVTAIVQRADGKVLLVQRSDKVGTFKQHWGGVSGYVEPTDSSLVARCLQEIQEEVGFPEASIKFVRAGRPLYVNAPRHRFCVHPFLFVAAVDELPPPELNWENNDAAFFLPAELRSLQTVPDLDLTIDRVVLPPRQEAALAALAADLYHGAAELALQVVEALGREAQALAEGCTEGGDEEGLELLERVRTFGYALAAARPSMAALANAASAVLAAAHRDLHSRASAFPPSRAEVAMSVDRASRQQAAALRDRGGRLRAAVRALLRDGQTVMTLSRSSTVEAAVAEAAADGLRLKAIVCESRPLCEGVAVARAWAAVGVDVTVITDAQAAIFAPQADLVLLGADSVTATTFSNKAGSHLLALAALAAGVPAYAAADSGKLSVGSVLGLAHTAPAAPAEECDEEEMGAGEVMAAWGLERQRLPPGVRVRNVYFERTPLALLSALLTEEGELAVDAIPGRLAALEEQHRLAFALQ